MAHAGLIFFLSSRSNLGLPLAFPHADKLLHAGAFGVLAFLVAWGLRRACPAWPLVRPLLIALLVTVLYGGLDELHQHFVPGRTSDPFDLLADGTGGLAAVLLVGVRTARIAGSGRRAGSRR